MSSDGSHCLQPQKDDEVQNQQANGSDDGATERGKSIFEFSFFEIHISSIPMLRSGK